MLSSLRLSAVVELLFRGGGLALLSVTLEVFEFPELIVPSLVRTAFEEISIFKPLSFSLISFEAFPGLPELIFSKIGYSLFFST